MVATAASRLHRQFHWAFNGAPVVAPLPPSSTSYEARTTRYGGREWSPNVIKRLEEACGVDILADGFPAEMTDHEPEEPGYEVGVSR